VVRDKQGKTADKPVISAEKRLNATIAGVFFPISRLPLERHTLLMQMCNPAFIW